MEIGLFSFVETTSDPETGHKVAPEQRLKNLIEEIELADALGLDVFGIGEHHRPEYVASAPTTLLAAAAVRTKAIRLTSAVTVLSSADPVRVFQEFSTIDLLSDGRAEIMVGRGSFIESFPLFGYDLDLYDELFAEKLDLLLQLGKSPSISWSGRHRPAIDDRGVYPRPIQEYIPIWIAVGGTPHSAVRAGRLGLPLALAIIGGLPERFVTFAKLHRQSAAEAGHPRPAFSINAHGFIADTSQKAADVAFPALSAAMNHIGKERGWPPMTRQQFDGSCSLRGANFVGSPQQIIDKILYQYEMFQHDRFLLQLTVGSLPHHKVMRSIELLGTEVAPVVKKEISNMS